MRERRVERKAGGVEVPEMEGRYQQLQELRAHGPAGNAQVSQADSGVCTGHGVDSADFACSFRVCSATQTFTCRRASALPWGQGQCASPPNSPCGKEATNTEHVNPVGPSSHPDHQPTLFQIHSWRVSFPAPHFHLTPKTSKAGGLRGSQRVFTLKMERSSIKVL